MVHSTFFAEFFIFLLKRRFYEFSRYFAGVVALNFFKCNRYKSEYKHKLFAVAPADPIKQRKFLKLRQHLFKLFRQTFLISFQDPPPLHLAYARPLPLCGAGEKNPARASRAAGFCKGGVLFIILLLMFKFCLLNLFSLLLLFKQNLFFRF